MVTLQSLHAIEILDSRGNPTLEVIAVASDGSIGKAAVPSGASTGEHEAVELRDADPKRYSGKGVLKAVANVNGPLSKLLVGKDIFNQSAIDESMLQADGTPNKSQFGANALLGISLAIAKAAACSKKQPLYLYLGERSDASTRSDDEHPQRGRPCRQPARFPGIYGPSDWRANF